MTNILMNDADAFDHAASPSIELYSYEKFLSLDFPDLIEYRSSDERFMKLGWTLLPVSKTIKKIAQYETRPAKPNLNWYVLFIKSGIRASEINARDISQ